MLFVLTNPFCLFVSIYWTEARERAVIYLCIVGKNTMVVKVHAVKENQPTKSVRRIQNFLRTRILLK